MTRKHFVFFAAAALIGLSAVSCKDEYQVNDTPINTAVKMISGELTANGAVVTLSPTQDVASYIVAGPVVKGTFDYVSADAIASLAWIKENGKSYPSPFEQSFSGLDNNTTYMLGFVALNSEGTVVSAPSFGTFTTKSISISISASLTTEAAPYIYSWSIEPDEFVNDYKYLISWDSAIVNLDDASLLAMIKAGGSDVLSATVSINDSANRSSKTDMVVAAVPYDGLGKAGNMAVSRVYTEEVVTVNCNGSSVKLSQPDKAKSYFTGEVDLPAQAKFTISRGDVVYGFLSCSGNGGVGVLDSQVNTAAPCTQLSNSTYKKTAYKSVGRMAEDGNSFWTNFSSAVKVKVEADFTYEDAIPRYKLHVVESDASVILRENFELFPAGGYYWISKANGPKYSNNDPSSMDGTEPVTQDGETYTTGGTLMIHDVMDETVTEGVVPSALFIENRDLTGWSYRRVYEHASAIRLGKSSSSYVDTYLTTPVLSSLSDGSTIEVSVNLSRFGTGGDPISIAVIGKGTITAASYGTHKVSGTSDGKAKIVDGVEFRADSDICPVVANADTDKPISTITLTVTGAGPDTRISIYPCKSNTGITNSRCLCHGITITKK